jgi:hypothetical protein
MYHQSFLDHILGKLLCGACLRAKFSPIHWVALMIGMCPGEWNYHD